MLSGACIRRSLATRQADMGSATWPAPKLALAQGCRCLRQQAAAGAFAPRVLLGCEAVPLDAERAQQPRDMNAARHLEAVCKTWTRLRPTACAARWAEIFADPVGVMLASAAQGRVGHR